jgi:hypothetical protein
MRFSPTVDALEDRMLMSSGGGNIDSSIPRYPSSSPGLNFTSNSFHQINAAVPKIVSAILQNPASTNAQLASYVAHIPYGVTSLLPILQADVATFQQGGNTITTAQANEAVTTLYLDLLGRSPDAGGLNSFSQALQNGATVAQVADVIVTSTEFIRGNITAGATGNANQTQFVTALYNDVLGRAPDPGGLNYWVNQINTSTLTVQQVAVAFVSSEEATTSDSSVLQSAAIPVASTEYYFGSVVPNGTILGNFPGTGAKAQLENLIQQDTLAYLGNGIGNSFNILKSGVRWASDNLLTYNGRVR